MKARAGVFLVLAVASAAFPAPFVFVLPGLAIAFLHDDRHPWPLSIPLSLAFWAVVLQILYWIHVPVRLPVTVLLVASAAAIAWKARKPDPHWIAAGILGAAVIFRLLPAFLHPCAGGIDMSFHTFLGGKIIEEGRVPADLRPVDGGGVPGLPLGFHFQMAALCLEANPSALWMSVAGYAALTLVLYRALVPFFAAGPSAVAAVVISFLADKPQSAVRYGSHPMVVAFVLTILAYALWMEGLRDRVRPVLVALAAAGGAIVHPTPAYGSVFLLFPALLFVLLRNRNRPRLLATTAAAALTLVLVVPYALGLRHLRVPPGAVEWTRTYLRRGNSRITDSSGWRVAPAVLDQASHELGPPFSGLAVLGTFYALWRRRRLAALLAAVLAGWVLTAVNLKLWVLPYSALLYPDRLLYFLILPVAPMLTAALEEGFARIRERRWGIPVAAAAAVAMIAVAGGRGVSRYLKTYGKNVLVQRADFEAMEWMRVHVPPEAIVLNEADAGLWIPAFAKRSITRPQGAPLYFPFPPSRDAAFLYVGSRPVERDPRAILRKLGILREPVPIFEKDGAVVYELR